MTFVFQIPVDQGTVLCLALADIEQVKKIRNGLRIIGAGTAADYNGHVFPALRRKKRNL